MSTFIKSRPVYPSALSLSSVGSTGTFTEIAALTNIGGYGITKGTVDVTNHGTTDGYEQVKPEGITRTKELSFTGWYLTTNTHHTTLLSSAMDAGAVVGWKVALAGTSSNNIRYGDGYITSYSLGDLGVAGQVNFTFTLKPTGKPSDWCSSTTS